MFAPATRTLLLFAITLAAMQAVLPAVQAQHPARDLATTRAELVKAVDSREANQGTSFYVKTTAEWSTSLCTVRANSMVPGEVVEVKRRKDGAAKEEVGVRFAPVVCYGNETVQVTPILIALQAPAPLSQGGDLRQLEMTRAMELLDGEPKPAGMIVNTDRRVPTGTNALAPNAENRTLADIHRDPITQDGIDPAADQGGIKTAEVKGMRGIAMLLPKTALDPTVLVSSHDIHLHDKTQFVLLFVLTPGTVRNAAPASVKEIALVTSPASTTASSMTAAAGPTKVPLHPPAPPAETEVCAASGCKQLDSLSTVASGNAAWRVSLAELGLHPRTEQVRLDRDDDASVNFLGSDQVLVTFNSHSLTRRSLDSAQDGSLDGDLRPRWIRAVVLSRKDGRVLQVKDWHVSQDGQYIWTLQHGLVLANLGHELVIYGPDLQVHQRYSLPGPLVSATISDGSGTDAQRIVITTEHEKHTPEAHRKLSEFLGPDVPIEEDYDLTVLNENLEPKGTQTLDVRPPDVAILDSGMVSARYNRGKSWKLQNENWDGKTKTLARFISGCEPEVTALPGKLLFVIGCAQDTQGGFDRLMTAQGATLLDGHFSDSERVQQVQGTEDGRVIAIATSQFIAPTNPSLGVKASDLRSLTISLYRSADGRKVFDTETLPGSNLRQTFALTPSGDCLAALSGSTLELYQVTPLEPSSASPSHGNPTPQ